METIEIDQIYRYTRSFDTDYFDYLTDWEHDTWGMFTIRHANNLIRLDLDTFGINDRIAAALEWQNRADYENVISKIITRAGYAYKFLDLQGYSQGAWHDVVIYWDQNLITETKGLIDELRAWYCGDVYNVTLDRREIYYGPDNKTIEKWETIESMGRVIFTDDYEFTLENCQELVGGGVFAAAQTGQENENRNV